MKKILMLLVVCMSSFVFKAQRPAADRFETSKGDLIIQPIKHATSVLTWNKKVIYIDPYGGAKAFEGLAAPDLIIITDMHPDHLSAETLATIICDKAQLLVPQAVADLLPEKLKNKAVILANGKTMELLGISISAIAMYNLPEVADSKHPKGRGNGYVLEMGGKRIYFSGDTEDISEMRDLKNIDVAFVCMNLPYTMTIEQAASAVSAFKPKIVYPFHYRGQDGFSDVEAFKKLVNSSDPKIEVRLRNWYPEYN